jgi:hypothetical protein
LGVSKPILGKCLNLGRADFPLNGVGLSGRGLGRLVFEKRRVQLSGERGVDQSVVAVLETVRSEPGVEDFEIIVAIKERIYGRPSRKVILVIVLTALDA